jgi:ubiquinone/menaquinone biosynthesis C-methylase UbiE
MNTFNEGNSNFYDEEYFLGLEFRYFSGAHENKLKTLLNFLGEVQGKKILDLGCGGGYFSYALAKIGAEVTSVDYSEQAVNFAQKRYPGLNFQVGTVYDLSNYENDEFDYVVMMDIIEHVNDQQKAVEEARRVLKKGGKIILSTDLKDTYWDNSVLKRLVWPSLRFSKNGRAYRLIKLTESKIPSKKYYGQSHIGLLSFNGLRNLFPNTNFKIIRQEVYPLVSVPIRDAILSFFPPKFRGEHQMIAVEKNR